MAEVLTYSHVCNDCGKVFDNSFLRARNSIARKKIPNINISKSGKAYCDKCADKRDYILE